MDTRTRGYVSIQHNKSARVVETSAKYLPLYKASHVKRMQADFSSKLLWGKFASEVLRMLDVCLWAVTA